MYDEEKNDGIPFWDNDCSSDGAVGIFSACYNFDDISHKESLIILVYFSFTTLSTVGLGDYHPKSNVERIFIAFALLFGVAIFSLMMSNFMQILGEFKKFDADLDQGDELSKFFGIL